MKWFQKSPKWRPRFLIKSKKRPTNLEVTTAAQGGILKHVIAETVEGPRRKNHPTIGLSMLDVMACGLGAVAFLGVLQMLIRTPSPPPLSQNYIMVELASTGFGQIGFLVRPPKSGHWFSVIPNDGNQRPRQGDDLVDGETKYATSVTYAQTYSTRNCDPPNEECRSVAYLHIEKPSIGEWILLPYYYQYRDYTPQNQVNDFRSQPLTELSCSYWSRDSDLALKGKDKQCSENDTLEFPGSIAKEVKIIVKGP